MEKTILAREFVSSTLCELDTDGYWKVTATIYDKAKFSDKPTEWIEEKVESSAIDKDYKNGIQVALSSCLGYLNDSVYANGFMGLLEFREFERNLKDASKAKDIQNTENESDSDKTNGGEVLPLDQ